MGTDTDRDTTEPIAPYMALGLPRERYTVGARIGRGGMGEVFEAYDAQLDRGIAIKCLRAPCPNGEQIARFLREARIQARLDHPAIVPVYELGRDREGRLFFAMRKLSGRTLSAILRTAEPRHPLLRAFVDVCLAVEFAHVHGVVHRDLKPANIVLGDFGEVYVIDWGIAKIAGDTDQPVAAGGDGLDTRAGTSFGTRAYMSPEQARDARDVDARTDVFALGKVLAEILVHDVPPELARVIAAATEPERVERIATARQLGELVQRYLDGDRDLALRRKLASDQLEAARAAHESGEDHRSAVRAAASAMALDPQLDGAAELVGRLMLEPPRELPPEVQDAIQAEDEIALRAQSRAALIGELVMFACVVPCLVVMGALPYAAVFAVIDLVAVLTTWHSLRRNRRPSRTVIALVQAAILVALAEMFSPVIAAPAVAGIMAFRSASDPFLKGRASLALVALAIVSATVLPAVAQDLGWLGRSVDVMPTGVLIHTATHVSEWMLVPSLAMYVIGIVTAAILLARLGRVEERTSRRQLHLQAWQLRQLVA
jgi:serine/threonine-protein kinase